MPDGRRLTAIMFTDMVGYTAATHADEAGTLRRVRELDEALRPILQEYRGRRIKSTGDGMLVEFESALQAAQCAIEIQRRLHERNARPGVVPVSIRLGVHLGDVEQQGADIFGDAVNIAARIEPLADPGGVCITGEVHAQVQNKISSAWARLPPQELKGLGQSIAVYRAVLPWSGSPTEAGTPDPFRIAVLPFANFSPDAHDEYFADGLTDELITVLSRVPDLRVIARTSVFPYKGTAKPMAQIGAELGVSTLLEGSVRMAGDRIRVTAQLIDVASQSHRWAESYDRKLEDVFAVQSEVAREVARALELRVGKTEESRLTGVQTSVPESYLAFLRGRNSVLQSYSEKNLREAQWQFERAITLDPTNARAHAGLAEATHLMGVFFRPNSRQQIDLVARELAKKAIQLDPNLADGHSALGNVLYDSSEWAAAEDEARLALTLNPNFSNVRSWYSMLLQEEGRAEEALREMRMARDSDPQSRMLERLLVMLLLNLGRLDEANLEIERYRALASSDRHYHMFLARYHLGRNELESARREAEVAETLPGEDGSRGPTSWQAIVYARMGRLDDARRVLRELEAPSHYAQQEEILALVYGAIGELDEAFRLLNQGAERGLALQTIRLDAVAEPIRKDPRFAQLLKRLKIPQ